MNPIQPAIIFNVFKTDRNRLMTAQTPTNIHPDNLEDPETASDVADQYVDQLTTKDRLTLFHKFSHLLDFINTNENELSKATREVKDKLLNVLLEIMFKPRAESDFNAFCKDRGIATVRKTNVPLSHVIEGIHLTDLLLLRRTCYSHSGLLNCDHNREWIKNRLKEIEAGASTDDIKELFYLKYYRATGTGLRIDMALKNYPGKELAAITRVQQAFNKENHQSGCEVDPDAFRAGFIAYLIGCLLNPGNRLSDISIRKIRGATKTLLNNFDEAAINSIKRGITLLKGLSIKNHRTEMMSESTSMSKLTPFINAKYTEDLLRIHYAEKLKAVESEQKFKAEVRLEFENLLEKAGKDHSCSLEAKDIHQDSVLSAHKTGEAGVTYCQSGYIRHEKTYIVLAGRINHNIAYIPKDDNSNITLVLTDAEYGTNQKQLARLLHERKNLALYVYADKTTEAAKIATRRMHAFNYVAQLIKVDGKRDFHFVDDNLAELKGTGDLPFLDQDSYAYSLSGENPFLQNAKSSSIGSKYLALRTRNGSLVDLVCNALKHFPKSAPCEDYFIHHVLSPYISWQAIDRNVLCWRKINLDNTMVNNHARNHLLSIEKAYSDEEEKKFFMRIDDDPDLSGKEALKESVKSFFEEIRTQYAKQLGEQHYRLCKLVHGYELNEEFHRVTSDLKAQLEGVFLRENSRKRVHDFCFERAHIEPKKLFLMQAPTGFGKTLLMAYINAMNLTKETRKGPHRILNAFPYVNLAREFSRELPFEPLAIHSDGVLTVESLKKLGTKKSEVLDGLAENVKSMVFCHESLFLLIEELLNNEQSALRPVFLDVTLFIDEVHLLTKTQVKLLNQFLLRTDARAILLSATPNDDKLHAITAEINESQIETLRIKKKEALQQHIIKPYFYMRKKGALQEDINEEIVSALKFRLGDSALHEQKGIIYVSGIAAGEKLRAMLKKRLPLTQVSNFTGHEIDQTFIKAEKGIAICVRRLREGSNCKPQWIMNAAKPAAKTFFTQTAGRVSRFVNPDDHTPGLYLDFFHPDEDTVPSRGIGNAPPEKLEREPDNRMVIDDDESPLVDGQAASGEDENPRIRFKRDYRKSSKFFNEESMWKSLSGIAYDENHWDIDLHEDNLVHLEKKEKTVDGKTVLESFKVRVNLGVKEMHQAPGGKMLNKKRFATSS